MSKKASRDDDDASREIELHTDKKMLERGFDRWLNRKLHEIYDEVLTEAVPDYMMRLVDEFASKTDTPPDDLDDDGGNDESKP
jgi:hypothetical protein